jgi:hypothetical protein
MANPEENAMTATEGHEFVPYHPDWAKPRCKVCREFADHRLHLERPRFQALYDPELMWWAVSDGSGCYANGLTEDEARALAAELTAELAERGDERGEL